MTTCRLMRNWRSASAPAWGHCQVISALHQTQDEIPLPTWIGEEPRGNVGTSAHDVLHIQTGLESRLFSSLSAHNPIQLREMLEAAAKQGHELSQVCRTVVLLQELQNGGRYCEIMPSQLMQHLVFWGYSEMTHLSYSLAVILGFSHISWCQVITGPQDRRSHSQVYSCPEAIPLPLQIGSPGVLLQFTRETMKSANCEETKIGTVK